MNLLVKKAKVSWDTLCKTPDDLVFKNRYDIQNTTRDFGNEC